MKNIVRLALVSVVVTVLVGCMPRGETKTLAEVLASAEARYQSAAKDGVSAEVSASLDKIIADLGSLTSADDVSGSADKVAALGETLAGLVTKAGFTSRPALNEIALQYRMLGGTAGEKLSAAQVKLLASRTYTVLAAELETTKFAL